MSTEAVEKPATTNEIDRERIAKYTLLVSAGVIFFSVLVVIVLMIVIATQSVTDEREDLIDLATLIFTATLPMAGTWIGTVLAFYFGAKNFQAASDAQKEVVDTLTRNMPAGAPSKTAADIMIPLGDIKAMVAAPGGDVGAIKLSDIKSAFETKLAGEKKVSRLLLYSGDGANRICAGILHLATWNEILSTMTPSPVEAASGDQTLKDVLGRKVPRNPSLTFADLIQKRFTAVPRAADLSAVKAALEAIDGNEDVIVTDTGSLTGVLVGWIPNDLLTSALKA